MDILCVLHDADEYGVVRWPLAELASAAGVPLKLARELADKSVLKGCDTGTCEAYTYTPRHGRQDGPTVILIPAQAGPIWFSSRMVRDEHLRTVRGNNTRFGAEDDGEHHSPGHSPKVTPKPPFGDGASSSTSSSSAEEQVPIAKAIGGAAALRVVSDTGKPEWWPRRDRYGRVLGELNDKLVYDVGKVVLGKSAGGQVQRLLKCYAHDLRSVADMLLQADDKSNPREWFAGVNGGDKMCRMAA